MANSEQNWLEQLSAKIPGFRGYLEKERRRDADKMQREHLAQQLQRLKSPLSELARELSESGRLMEVKPLERVTSKLDKIENTIRYASYGYSGFFDIVKVREAQLDRLYQFDLALSGDIEAIKDKVGALAENVAHMEVKQAVTALERALDELSTRFSERHKMIESMGN